MITSKCYFCGLEQPYMAFDHVYKTYMPASYNGKYADVCSDCVQLHLTHLCPCCEEKRTNKYGGLCGLCNLCGITARNSMVNNRHRAKRLGHVVDMTLEEWLEVLQAFDFKCAYCRVKRYSLLEHFIPISAGGSTSIYNCVPACQSCNRRKNDKNPNAPDFKCSIPSADIERVRQYLTSR